MSVSTLILGQSGTGKTASLRNLDPESTALIKAVEKPLSFRSTGWKSRTTDQWQAIINTAQVAVERGRKVVVIDDFQYVMANEFMRRSEERGFDKFTEIARHAWEIINALSALPSDVRVYIMAHTQGDDMGRIKIKTIGKMLDEKITLEGLFSIVLRTQVQDGNYMFRTTNNGSDTVKAPMGLFESDFIENDLAAVDAAICEYYGLTQPAQEA